MLDAQINFNAVEDRSDKTFTRTMRYLGISGPTLYVAGGDTLTAEQVGMGRIDLVIPAGVGLTNGTNVLFAQWIPETPNAPGKLKYFTANNAEAAGDLSAYSGLFMIIGE